MGLHRKLIWVLHVLRFRGEGKGENPQTMTILSQDFCMDDVLSGCDDVTEALKLQADLMISLLASAGFPVRKWCANLPTILEAVPNAAWESVQTNQLNGEDKVKTFSLCWHPTLDIYYFQ